MARKVMSQPSPQAQMVDQDRRPDVQWVTLFQSLIDAVRELQEQVEDLAGRVKDIEDNL